MSTVDSLGLVASGTITRGQSHLDILASGSLLPLERGWDIRGTLTDNNDAAPQNRKFHLSSPNVAFGLGPDVRAFDRIAKSMTIESSKLVTTPEGFAYDLSVRLSTDLLAAAHPAIGGRLLIDAETFLLLHADWESAEFELHVNLFKQDQEIFPGLGGSGTSFISESIFDTIFEE